MIHSPSKFHSVKFLKYLRENHYIAKSGKEFVRCEVDHLYFEKLTTKSVRMADLLFKDRSICSMGVIPPNQ